MQGQKNWDPGVKRFFVKILNTVALALMWMMAAATAGLYFKLAFWEPPYLYPIIYYTALLLSLGLLVRYLYNSWKDFKEEHD